MSDKQELNMEEMGQVAGGWTLRWDSLNKKVYLVKK